MTAIAEWTFPRSGALCKRHAAQARRAFARTGVVAFSRATDLAALQDVYAQMEIAAPQIAELPWLKKAAYGGYQATNYPDHTMLFLDHANVPADRCNAFDRAATQLMYDATRFATGIRTLFAFPAVHDCVLEHHPNYVGRYAIMRFACAIARPRRLLGDATTFMRPHKDLSSHFTKLPPATSPGLEMFLDGAWIDAFRPEHTLLLAGAGFNEDLAPLHQVRCPTDPTIASRTAAVFGF